MNHRSSKKRFAALFVAVVMVFSMAPMMVSADGTVIYSFLEDAGVQGNAVGTQGGNALLDNTAFWQDSGGPTFVFIQNPVDAGAVAIRITDKSQHWETITLMRAALNSAGFDPAENSYAIRVLGSVPVGAEINVQGAGSPWDALIPAEVAANGRFVIEGIISNDTMGETDGGLGQFAEGFQITVAPGTTDDHYIYDVLIIRGSLSDLPPLPSGFVGAAVAVEEEPEDDDEDEEEEYIPELDEEEEEDEEDEDEEDDEAYEEEEEYEATELPGVEVIAPPVHTIFINTLVLTVDSLTYTIGYEPATLSDAPFVQDGITMLPLRVIADALGASVSWNDATRTATFTHNGTTATATIGERIYNAAGAYIGTPVIVNGRTFIPLDFVSGQMGVEVDWNPAARTVTMPVPF